MRFLNWPMIWMRANYQDFSDCENKEGRCLQIIHSIVCTICKQRPYFCMSKNILEIPPARLPEIRVDMTLFDGRIVHRRY